MRLCLRLVSLLLCLLVLIKAVGVYSSWVKQDRNLKTNLPAHCVSPGGAVSCGLLLAQQLSGLSFLRSLSLPLSSACDVLLYECCYCKAASSCSQLSAGLHWCCRLLTCWLSLRW